MYQVGESLSPLVLSPHRTDSSEDFYLISDLSYLYDNQNEIGAFDEQSQTICELRILGNTPHAEIGASVAFELYGEAYLPIHDLQGNVASLISLLGQQTQHYLYTAFGEESVLFSTNPWRFSSKRIDPETGFIFYGRRHYIPELGRWLTQDPLGIEAGPVRPQKVMAKSFDLRVTTVGLANKI